VGNPKRSIFEGHESRERCSTSRNQHQNHLRVNAAKAKTSPSRYPGWWVGLSTLAYQYSDWVGFWTPKQVRKKCSVQKPGQESWPVKTRLVADRWVWACSKRRGFSHGAAARQSLSTAVYADFTFFPPFFRFEPALPENRVEPLQSRIAFEFFCVFFGVLALFLNIHPMSQYTKSNYTQRLNTQRLITQPLNTQLQDNSLIQWPRGSLPRARGVHSQGLPGWIKPPLRLWDTHYQCSIKILLSKYVSFIGIEVY